MHRMIKFTTTLFYVHFWVKRSLYLKWIGINDDNVGGGVGGRDFCDFISANYL